MLADANQFSDKKMDELGALGARAALENTNLAA